MFKMLSNYGHFEATPRAILITSFGKLTMGFCCISLGICALGGSLIWAMSLYCYSRYPIRNAYIIRNSFIYFSIIEAIGLLSLILAFLSLYLMLIYKLVALNNLRIQCFNSV